MFAWFVNATCPFGFHSPVCVRAALTIFSMRLFLCHLQIVLRAQGMLLQLFQLVFLHSAVCKMWLCCNCECLKLVGVMTNLVTTFYSSLSGLTYFCAIVEFYRVEVALIS